MISEEEMKEMVNAYLSDQSFILVVFNDSGSVLKSVAMNNIVPSQLLALGSELELIGKNWILDIQSVQKEQKQSGIIVPNPKIEVP